jgi:hypothetical protein
MPIILLIEERLRIGFKDLSFKFDPYLRILISRQSSSFLMRLVLQSAGTLNSIMWRLRL